MIKVVKMMIIMCFLSQQSCSVVISFYPCLILTIVHHVLLHFQSVSQFSHSRVRLFAIPWTVALQASLSITTSCSLLKLKSIELVMSSNHLILCCPLYKVQFRTRQKRRDDLNGSRLPLFRQGEKTVGLTTRLSTERDQGGSIFIGRFVEVIRETSIRRDVLGIFQLRWHLQLGRG